MNNDVRKESLILNSVHKFDGKEYNNETKKIESIGTPVDFNACMCYSGAECPSSRPF